MKNKNVVNRGFTLVELLIVVLIIGVLMSIALPMYQGTVDKIRWAKLLTPSRAIANAEEAILMSKGRYTTEKDDLSISLPDAGEYTYTLYTTENGDDGNFVRLESDKLADVRLKRYYTQDENYPEMLFCEALSTNSRANALCEKRLQGVKMGNNTSDGYKLYLVNGEVEKINESGCNAAELWWSSSRGMCYQTQEKKCTALGANVLSDGSCGYMNGEGSGSTIGAELVCKADTISGCKGKHFTDGGKCIVVGGYTSCGYSDTTFSNGAECIAKAGSRGCYQVTINEGSICRGYCEGAKINGGVCTADGTTNGGALAGCLNTIVKDSGICTGGSGSIGCSGATFSNGSVCYEGAGCRTATYNDATSCCCGSNCPSGKTCSPAKCDATRARLEAMGVL